MPTAPLEIPVAGLVNGRKTLLVAGPIHMALNEIPQTVASRVLMTVAIKESLMSAMLLLANMSTAVQPLTASIQLVPASEINVYGPMEHTITCPIAMYKMHGNIKSRGGTIYQVC